MMMGQELNFSIIIPLYNKELYIERAIYSVQSQIITNWELIIVDDGSTDDSIQRISDLQDKRINVIKQSNQGEAAARNRGIKEVKNEIICFLDADDYWSPDFLLEISRLANKYPQAEIYIPNYCIEYNGNHYHHKIRGLDRCQEDGILSNFYETITGNYWIINSSCNAIKRERLLMMDKFFPVGSTVYCDFDFWLRLCPHSIIAYSKKVCAYYCREVGNNTRVSHHKKIIWSNALYETINEILVDPNIGENRKYILEFLDRRIGVYIISMIIANKKKDALRSLHSWHPKNKYYIYKYVFLLFVLLPSSFMEHIYYAKK